MPPFPDSDYSTYVWLIVAFVVSVVNFFFPRFAWWCAEGWKFKNVKPSRLWLFLNRLGSALAAIGVLVIAFVIYKSEQAKEPPKTPPPKAETKRHR